MKTIQLAHKALKGLSLNEQTPTWVWLSQIKSRLQTPPTSRLSLPASVSSESIEHMVYRRSSVQSYQTNTVSEVGPSQCAGLNETSMHMDLKKTEPKSSGLLCQQGSLLAIQSRVQRNFPGQISKSALSTTELFEIRTRSLKRTRSHS